MATTYDFIVVGAGPAGAAVAAGLAHASSKPRVLLLEAGGQNSDRSLRVDGQRWITHLQQQMNWGYMTTPQPELQGRELHYPRGKGLGGSSAINFSLWTRGARDDYDEWARIVNDQTFSWERMLKRFQSLEAFDGAVPKDIPGVEQYAAPKAGSYGSAGPLKLGFSTEWETDVPAMFELFAKAGFPFNPDSNSGNPLGLSAAINTAYKGVRSTAADLLIPRPENLTILTEAPVQRVMLDGKKAVGVESDGKQHFASKEVVLCAGSLNTPSILMHSGIGPRDQLETFDIPVKHVVSTIGQGLRDHMLCPLVWTRKEGSTERSFYSDKTVMDAALQDWTKNNGTGLWSKFGCQTGIGYFKLNDATVSQLREFQDLPEDEKRFLALETIPHYEILTHVPAHWILPDFPVDDIDAYNCSCILVFYGNAQSRGSATLQSKDPNVPLKFNPRFLEHQFDRRVAIESLRAALRVAKSEGYTRDNVKQLVAPEGDSDDQLLNHWRRTMSSSFHPTGTVEMGNTQNEPEAAVDSDFRLIGLEGLRIADMSVVPLLPSGHVQAVAYVTGVTCAEKLVGEYGL